tara:strand:+ start:226 stop:483 length:258 start_codon:yes stop_codon:yes gene_type:complete
MKTMITKELDTYISYDRKIKRMQDVMGGGFRMEMCAEYCKPLITDGFDLEDIVEYFILELRDYSDNRYDDDIAKDKEREELDKND